MIIKVKSDSDHGLSYSKMRHTRPDKGSDLPVSVVVSAMMRKGESQCKGLKEVDRENREQNGRSGSPVLF